MFQRLSEIIGAGNHTEASPTKEVIPHYYTKLVTPEEAKKILDERNTSNRKLSTLIVGKYAREMSSGNWINNGDTIAFDTNGVLLNGQHRLNALVASGKTIMMNFVSGLPPEAYETIDLQRRRTVSNFFEVAGIKNSAMAAGVTRRLLQWEQTVDKTRFSFKNEAWQRITERDQLEYVKENEEEIQDAISCLRGSHPWKNCGAQSALVTALIICRRYNREEADLFFDGLKTGASLPMHSPVSGLRDRMIAPPKTRYKSMWDLEVMALTLKSFNKFMNKESIQILKWSIDGTMVEKFPVLHKKLLLDIV